MKENASKRGRTATQASLALCDGTILITNVEPERLSLKDSLLLYSVRWQILCCSNCGKVMANWGIPAVRIRGVGCVNAM